MDTIAITVFVQLLSNFTCKLCTMRGGTLLILGHGVKGQGQLCPPARGCHALRCLVKVCLTSVSRPFCFRFVFYFFIKVSDFSRKPFCFRSVFSSLLFFLFFFSFFLYHLVCSAITLSILNRFTSNFHSTLIVNRWFDLYTFERNRPRGRDRVWPSNLV